MFLPILADTVNVLLLVIETAMMLRAILSFFPLDEENRFVLFLALVTEPVIAPVRALLSRFKFIAESPIDISFFVTFLLLSILRVILPVY